MYISYIIVTYLYENIMEKLYIKLYITGWLMKSNSFLKVIFDYILNFNFFYLLQNSHYVD